MARVLQGYLEPESKPLPDGIHVSLWRPKEATCHSGISRTSEIDYQSGRSNFQCHESNETEPVE